MTCCNVLSQIALPCSNICLLRVIRAIRIRDMSNSLIIQHLLYYTVYNEYRNTSKRIAPRVCMQVITCRSIQSCSLTARSTSGLWLILFLLLFTFLAEMGHVIRVITSDRIIKVSRVIRFIRVIIRMNINIHERCQLHSLEGLLEECKWQMEGWINKNEKQEGKIKI